MTTTQPTEETTTMRVPPSPDAPTPTDRTPEPVRVVYLPEVITDRAAIRDSDEADEPRVNGDLLRAMCEYAEPAPGVVAHRDNLSAMIQRLSEFLDSRGLNSWKHGACWAAEDAIKRLTERAEAAEAEVERLRNGREAKVEWLRAVHDDLVPNVARVIWDASRADEGTISATGANVVAEALLSDRDALCALVDTAEGEVAMLRRGARELGRTLDHSLTMALDASGRHDVIEEDGDGDWEIVWETLAGLRPRAESAEAEVVTLRAQVAAVEAQRDEWAAKWKTRGVHLNETRKALAAAEEESAYHLSLIDGETALALVKSRAALATTGEGK